MKRPAVSWKQTDVSEMFTVYIMREMNSFIDLIMEAVRTSETSVYFHEITQRYIPQICHLRP
jgi:hypothetical protein